MQSCTEENGACPSVTPELNEAVRAAQSSMRQFLAAFHKPEPQQSGFHLKVAFHVNGEVEQVWLSEIDLNPPVPTGLVAGDCHLPGFVPGLRVPFEVIRITDWMYSDDNAMVGGFTTRALLKMQVRTAASAWVEVLSTDQLD